MKVAIYIRVSTAAQTERFGLDAQKRILADLCEDRGWDHELYEDAGISGETIEARPAMMRLLRDAGGGEFEKCVVIEMERLSRSTDMLDWLIIKKTFRENGITIVTPGQEFDLADEEDDFLSDLFGALSKREKQKIVRRMKRGKVEAARSGQWVPVVSVPFGYDYDGEAKRLRINEEEAEIIQQMYEWYAEGGNGFAKIAQRLSAMGVHTRRSGTKWSSPTVDQMLRNRAYVGEGRFGDVTVRVPPIVTEELYARAQTQRSVNLKRSRRNSKYVYLLTGLLTCAECDSRFRGRGRYGRNGAHRYYHCWGKIAPLHQNKGCKVRNWRCDDVDDAVWREVCEIINEPGLASRIIATQRQIESKATDDGDGAVEHTQAKLAALQAEEDRLWRAWRKQAPAMTEEQLEKQLAEVTDERQTLETLLSEQDGASAAARTARWRVASLERWLEDASKRLDDLTREERKDLLHTVLESVLIDDDGNMELRFAIPINGRDGGGSDTPGGNRPDAGAPPADGHLQLFDTGQAVSLWLGTVIHCRPRSDPPNINTPRQGMPARLEPMGEPVLHVWPHSAIRLLGRATVNVVPSGSALVKPTVPPQVAFGQELDAVGTDAPPGAFLCAERALEDLPLDVIGYDAGVRHPKDRLAADVLRLDGDNLARPRSLKRILHEIPEHAPQQRGVRADSELVLRSRADSQLSVSGDRVVTIQLRD